MMRIAAVWVLAVGAGLLPPVGAADPPPPTAKQLAAARKNMKQLIVAFYNYAATNEDRLPNNVYGRNGKPALSWRVLILPFVEQDKLYREFRLDEPWDSENNKKLIAKMPKVYAPVRGEAEEGETFYRGFDGPGTLFGPGKMVNLTAVPDGLEATAAVFEAREPVVWTKPEELPFDPAQPLPKLGGMFDGEFHVGLLDGTVIRCRKDADPRELKRLIQYADGEPVNFNRIRAR